MQKEKVLYLDIDIDKIMPSRFQMRQVVVDEALQDLAASIKEKGVVQSITVRRVGEKYECVAGARRVAACRLVQQATVPALVKEISDEEALAWSVIENIHHLPPTLLEEAKAFQQLAAGFGGNPSPVAEMIGKRVSYVKERLAILDSPQEIQQNSEELGIARLRVIAKITKEEAQIKMAEQALAGNLSALAIAAYSQTVATKPAKAPLAGPTPEEIVNKANKTILRSFVEIKHLNEVLTSSPEKSSAPKTAISQDPFFLKNLKMLTEEIEKLSENLSE